MTTAKVFRFVKAFEGEPKDENIELCEEKLQALQEGEVLFKAVFLSVDPYMRVHGNTLGQPVVGSQVARVTESKNEKYPVGSEWLCMFGWRSHTVLNPTSSRLVRPMPPLKDLPLSLALGTVGMPGGTAYHGLIHCANPKKGETLLVNAASGAVGNVVGQLGKIKGLTVIGCAGSEQKVQLLKDLGFDHVFNYKTTELSEYLSKVAPDGVDIYYDNVGGAFSSTVLTKHMKKFGRVVLIGGISIYNEITLPLRPDILPSFLHQSLTMKSFIYSDVPLEHMIEGSTALAKYVAQGKIKYYEHVTEGFENMRSAFYGLFKGENVGKAIIKA